MTSHLSEPSPFIKPDFPGLLNCRSIFHDTPVLCETILNPLPVAHEVRRKGKKLVNPQDWALQIAIPCYCCRAVLLHLAYRADEYGRVEFSLKEITQSLSLSTIQAKSSLHKLLADTLIMSPLDFNNSEDVTLLYAQLRNNQNPYQFNLEGKHIHG